MHSLILPEQEIDIIALSNNMGDSKQDLLAYIEAYFYPMEDEYVDAKFLVQSEKDLLKWIELFSGDGEIIGEVNQRLRLWKISERLKYGYEEFSELLYMDKEDWMSTYYQVRCSGRDLEELERLLDEISVRDLYEMRLRNVGMLH